jgi:hypothetical protein
MLSDVLQRSVELLDRYMTEFPEVYNVSEGGMLKLMRPLRDQIDNMRGFIDESAVSAAEDMVRTTGKDFAPNG